ncbi:MAG: trypsin-like peptidase domain-containing protein [Caldilineales bacterium]|nr:trypsin-like peptidase domain-containing protein [Caldilineales bacterium]
MSDFVKQLSDGLADAVAKAGESVVRVDGRRRLSASGIVWSADGVIVTANHVVRRDENLAVGLPNGERADAELVGRDPSTDLAVLRTTADLTPAVWAEPDSLRVGQLVLAVGRPDLGLQSTLGVVSASGGAWQTGGGGKIDSYLQTDVVMYPGFSGGALVTVAGEVAGLNSSALARGVSLTLPAPTLRRVVASLLEHGHVRRGYLGVGVQSARLPANLAEQLGQKTGVLVTSVEPDGPAESAGLVLGDTLINLDGQALRHVDDLQAALSGEHVGVPVPLRIVRGGQVQELSVTIAERA